MGEPQRQAGAAHGEFTAMARSIGMQQVRLEQVQMEQVTEGRCFPSRFLPQSAGRAGRV